MYLTRSTALYFTGIFTNTKSSIRKVEHILYSVGDYLTNKYSIDIFKNPKRDNIRSKNRLGLIDFLYQRSPTTLSEKPFE